MNACLWCGDDIPAPEHLCTPCKSVDGALALLAWLYHSDGDEDVSGPVSPQP